MLLRQLFWWVLYFGSLGIDEKMSEVDNNDYSITGNDMDEHEHEHTTKINSCMKRRV
jgi:hypothetical protein